MGRTEKPSVGLRKCELVAGFMPPCLPHVLFGNLNDWHAILVV